MSRTKEVGTAVGTLACALAIGFAMQNTETASQRYGALKDTTSSQAVAAATLPVQDTVDEIPMDVQEIIPTSALDKDDMTDEPAPKGFLGRLFGSKASDQVEKVPAVGPKADATPTQAAAAAKDADPVEAQVEEIEDTDTVLASKTETDANKDAQNKIQTVAMVEEPAHICDIVANATPKSGAFVTLSVTAGCDPNTQITIHHNGMLFSGVTDNVGQLDLDVPALSAAAVFIIEVEPGRGAVAQTTVADLTAYNRVVVQWQGASGFELHAREFGADYGTDGHIWYGAEAGRAGLENGAGGYLVRLGSDNAADALMADVYTFPAAMSGRNGHIDLSVEAVVTQSNCGQMIEAQTIELRDAGELRTQSVTLAVPSCDAIGNFMVLNNLLDDIQIAAR